MRCNDAQGLIAKRLYEALTTAETEGLQAHLDRCMACREEAAGAAGFEERLLSLRDREAKPVVPTRVDLDRVFSGGRPAPMAPRVLRFAAGAAAVVGAGMLGGALLRHTPHQPGVAQQPHPVPVPAAGSHEPRQANTPQAPTTAPPKEQPRLVRAVPRTSHPASPAVTKAAPALAKTPARTPDTSYLDGRDPALNAAWLAGSRSDRQARGWLERQLPPLKDDFIRIPLPRLADAKGGTAAGAIQDYEREAKTVDARLFQKVTVQLKAASLEELCVELERQTRVRLRPARGVGDEKATVLVKDLPARDVMRAVARLFGYLWARTGEAGAYRYELTQDLRSQLAEQEMRSRDMHEALLALDAKMEAYRPYLELTPEQAKARLAQTKGPERALLAQMVGPHWGGIQVYHRLTPSERALLGQGQELKFSSGSARPDRRMPAEWMKPLLDTWDMGLVKGSAPGERYFGQGTLLKREGTHFTPLSELPGGTALVNLKVDHSELGELSLSSESQVFVELDGSQPGYGQTTSLGNAQSPSVARPNNAAANAALRNQAPFTQTVTLKPEPSCPRLKAEAESKAGAPKPQGPKTPTQKAADQAQQASDEARLAMAMMKRGRVMNPEKLQRDLRLSHAHLLAADVWEAVHRETGLPVVADAYSRLYDAQKLTIEKATLFEALSRAADELGVRWRKDGQFLLCRSTSFFWDKLKEVPNRDLDHWKRDKTETPGLPLADLSEMALLTDEQLDSTRVGEFVMHCRDLPEWDLLQTPIGYYSPRPWLRWLAGLPIGSAARAAGPEGLPLSSLNPAALQEAGQILGPRFSGPGATPQALAEWRLQVQFAPGGSYAWLPTAGPGRDQNQASELPVAWGNTPEAALAAARRIDPAAGSDEIERTEGMLCVRLLRAGSAPWLVGGQRPIGFRLPQ